MSLLFYRWRYVAVADPRPWKKRPGVVLKWEMTEDDAARHMAANPGEIIEKVPGSESERAGSGKSFRP